MRSGVVAGSAIAAGAAAHAVATLRGLDGLAPRALALNVTLLAVELVLIGFAVLLVATLRRPALPPTGAPADGPVDVLVPVRDEDPRVLRETLRAALSMERPAGGFRVIVVDDSSADRAVEIERLCAEMGVTRVARPARRGYKAGALNDALAISRAPLVAVLDVDHQPSPRFLVEALARFAPDVAFVQTIIAWRNEDTLLRRLAGLLQHQFYHGVQMDKGARERAVFTGSGAVFRRRALDDVGGFPEETLVEDFDLSLRLCAAGWKGRFAPIVGARGLLPWSARDLARQLWRWSHGTTEAVRLRAREVLSSRQAPLLPRIELLLDGCAYLAGGAIVAAALLLVVAGLAGIPIARPLDGWALLLAPASIALAHVASAAHALRVSGARGYRLLPLYHVVSLAFTPVLLASSVVALVGRGRAWEGRVSKARTGSTRGRSGLRVGIAATILLGATGLLAALLGALPLPAAGWVGLLGLSFVATVVTAWPAAAPPAPGTAD